LQAVFLVLCIFATSCSHTKYHYLDNNYDQLHIPKELSGRILWIRTNQTFATYDPQGRLFYSKIAEPVNSDTVVLYENFYKYDKSGNLKEHKGSKLFNQTETKSYDKHGNIHQEFYTNSDANEVSYYFYDYQSDGKVIVFLRKNNNPLIKIQSYCFDKNGNQIEHNFFDNQGKLISSESCKYNNRNLLIEKRIIPWMQHEIVETYQYDNSKNVIIHETFFKNGVYLDKKVIRYNHRNLPQEVHELIYDSSRNVTSVISERNEYRNGAQLLSKTDEILSGLYTTVDSTVFLSHDDYGNYLVKETFLLRKKNNNVISQERYKEEREIEYYH